MAKNTAVFGIYRDRMSAENAVDVLREANFRNTDISALLPENLGTKDFAHEKNTKAPEGVAAGVTTGAVVGGNRARGSLRPALCTSEGNGVAQRRCRRSQLGRIGEQVVTDMLDRFPARPLGRAGLRLPVRGDRSAQRRQGALHGQPHVGGRDRPGLAGHGMHGHVRRLPVAADSYPPGRYPSGGDRGQAGGM